MILISGRLKGFGDAIILKVYLIRRLSGTLCNIHTFYGNLHELLNVWLASTAQLEEDKALFYHEQMMNHTLQNLYLDYIIYYRQLYNLTMFYAHLMSHTQKTNAFQVVNPFSTGNEFICLYKQCRLSSEGSLKSSLIRGLLCLLYMNTTGKSPQ